MAKKPTTRQSDKELNAMISSVFKLPKDEEQTNPLSLSALYKISNHTKSKLNDSSDISDIFSEIDLSKRIITSSILSPNDMVNSQFLYKIERSNEFKVPSIVTGQIVEVIKNQMTNKYGLEKSKATVIEEALFEKGAYAEAIIPYKIIHNMTKAKSFNSSMEEYVDTVASMNVGVFDKDYASEVEVSTEDFSSFDKPINTKRNISTDFLCIEVSDNLALLESRSEYTKTLSKRMYATVAMEDIEDIGGIYELNSIGEGHGLATVIKLPVESVIPIHLKGDPKNHVGYFVLLNENGVPINDADKWNNDLSSRKNANELLLGTDILKRAKNSLKGFTTEAPTLDNMEELYVNVLIKTLKNRLENSMLKDVADVSEMGDITTMLFSRALANAKTRMLFVPSSMLSYIAFNYRNNGTGESYLEQTSFITSLRAMLLFSRILSTMKNSITNTNIKAVLDEADVSPDKAREIIMAEALKSREMKLPFGISKIDDLVDWVHKLGFTIDVKHPGIPDMEIEIEESTKNYTVPDDSLEDLLLKLQLNKYGVNKEMVDAGRENIDFAATIVANNALFARHISVLQDTYTEAITYKVQKILHNDFDVKDRLKDIIDKNFNLILKNLPKPVKEKIYAGKDKSKINKSMVIDWVLFKIINNIKLYLPSPELSDNNIATKEMYDNYKASIEDYVGAFFSDEALPSEIVGMFGDNAESFRTAILNTLLRNWMTENNYLNDLNQMATVDEVSGKPVLNPMEEFNDYILKIAEGVSDSYKTTSKVKKKLEKLSEKINGSGGNTNSEPPEEEEEINWDEKEEQPENSEPKKPDNEKPPV